VIIYVLAAIVLSKMFTCTVV